MAKQHFCRTCQRIPEDTREKLHYILGINRRASGGKEYWSQGLHVLRAYEDGNIMRFKKSKTEISNPPLLPQPEAPPAAPTTPVPDTSLS